MVEAVRISILSVSNLLRIADRNIERDKPDILVCTPGRLIDVITSFDLDISSVDYLVLDEGDRMLDMGFQEDIELILSHIKN
jgi:superfamily II DNA/RNA helicase